VNDAAPVKPLPAPDPVMRLILEPGPYPILVQSVEATTVKVEGEKEPKKVFMVHLTAVLDAWQLAYLFNKVEGHQFRAKALSPTEMALEQEAEEVESDEEPHEEPFVREYERMEPEDDQNRPVDEGP
jgi:hypothetical protein